MMRGHGLVVGVAIALFLIVGWGVPGFARGLSLTEQTPTNSAVIERAFRNGTRDLQVLVLGRVVSILPDDTRGDRHQRFIIELDNGLTLLVAHNIDLAPRIDALRVGDTVQVYGEYEWNERGGVIHWTHHDPNGQHVDGWIEHNGRRFQ